MTEQPDAAKLYIHKIDPAFSPEEAQIYDAGFLWSLTADPVRPTMHAQILNYLRTEADVDACIANAKKFGLGLEVVTR